MQQTYHPLLESFSSLTRSQASGRLRAHYHCVVCSVTIARKTDMVSHLKRHVNKGETEASYSGSSEVLCEQAGEQRTPAAAWKRSLAAHFLFALTILLHVSAAPSGQVCEIMKELGTNVQLLPNYSTPQKSDTYFNRKMKTNR